jgi:hypothetical protein
VSPALTRPLTAGPAKRGDSRLGGVPRAELPLGRDLVPLGPVRSAEVVGRRSGATEPVGLVEALALGVLAGLPRRGRAQLDASGLSLLPLGDGQVQPPLRRLA